jgi:hypothetical protein
MKDVQTLPVPQLTGRKDLHQTEEDCQDRKGKIEVVLGEVKDASNSSSSFHTSCP